MKFILSVLTALCAVSTASAADIWATDNLGEINGGTIGDRIIRYDSANPSNVTVVGATGIAGTLMGGLDFTPDGRLWAWGQTGAAGLYEINTSNGSASFVGSGSRNDVLRRATINDLAYNPVTGKMLGIAATTGRISRTSLYEIDLATGATTRIARLSGSFLPVGLAVDSAGNAYFEDLISDAIYRINGTSATPLPNAMGFDANFSQGMTINWAGGDVGHVGAFNNSTFSTEERTFTVGSGATTLVGNIGPFNSGTGLPEYEPGDVAIRPIPEPATIAIMGLGLLAIARRSRA